MKIVIAGGGTGGHLFPGIAIAQEFKKKDKSVQILFAGTKNGIESKIIPKEGFEIKYISSEGFKGRGILRKLKSLGKIPAGIIQSIGILSSFKPNIVIGVGGYASLPVGAASLLSKYPLVIQEQNIFPGIANRILGRFADLIFVSFEETKKFFKNRKVCFTGNPIRKEIAECALNQVRRQNPKFTLFVSGGSQGAHSINMTMIDGFKFLEEVKNSIHIIHQTGEKDFEFVKRVYDENGFDADVSPFIHNMADVYRRADLLVCRAGATTLSEITACGKAAILIPFPFAVNNHQEINALALKNNDAADVILEKDLNGRVLAGRVLSLMQDRMKLLKMGNESKKTGKPDAAKEIVEQCCKLVEKVRSGRVQELKDGSYSTTP